MYHKIKLKTLCAALNLGVLAALSAPVHAANDAMVDLLKILRDKGSITSEEYELLVAAARADDETNSSGQAEIKTAAATLPKIETKGKLEFATTDGEFSWRLGGRLHGDWAWYDNDQGTDAGGGTRTTSLASGSEIRRARFDVTATAWRVWAFKLQYDFTDSGQAGFRDAWIRYLFKGAQPGHITVGKQKEAFSLDELTSSNDDPWLEQSLTEIFYPSRRLGVQGSTWGNIWTVTAGVFGEDSTVTGSQPSCSASVSASSGSITTCTGNASEGWAVLGRLTVSPIHTPASDRVVHLGFAANHRKPDDVDSFRLSARPESRIARDVLIDSGSISGVDAVNRFGFEASGNYGPASLQGEYFWMNIDRQTSDNVSFDGFYIMGSYRLTGESRPYRFEDGVFQNPKPNGVVGKGGIGAWEVVLRYSSLDLSDPDLSLCNALDSSNTCGEQDNLTAGLNWYPTPNFKIMAHWVQVLDIEGGNFDGAEPGILQMRTQAYW